MNAILCIRLLAKKEPIFQVCQTPITIIYYIASKYKIIIKHLIINFKYSKYNFLINLGTKELLVYPLTSPSTAISRWMSTCVGTTDRTSSSRPWPNTRLLQRFLVGHRPSLSCNILYPSHVYYPFLVDTPLAISNLLTRALSSGMRFLFTFDRILCNRTCACAMSSIFLLNALHLPLRL